MCRAGSPLWNKQIPVNETRVETDPVQRFRTSSSTVRGRTRAGAKGARFLPTSRTSPRVAFLKFLPPPQQGRSRSMNTPKPHEFLPRSGPAKAPPHQAVEGTQFK